MSGWPFKLSLVSSTCPLAPCREPRHQRPALARGSSEWRLRLRQQDSSGPPHQPRLPGSTCSAPLRLPLPLASVVSLAPQPLRLRPQPDLAASLEPLRRPLRRRRDSTCLVPQRLPPLLDSTFLAPLRLPLPPPPASVVSLAPPLLRLHPPPASAASLEPQRRPLRQGCL